MKFWIRIDGLQEGPMEIDQLKKHNITPTTYVWCAGMKDWAYARDVADLKDVIVTVESTEEGYASSAMDETTDDVTTPQPETQVDEEVAPAKQPKPEPVQSKRPCPPNNLVWAILATILCCQFTGIIAIIFAAQVNNKYYREGYKAAKKYSDMAGIWCIISVVLAILSYSIFIPFMFFAPLL